MQRGHRQTVTAPRNADIKLGKTCNHIVIEHIQLWKCLLSSSLIRQISLHVPWSNFFSISGISNIEYWTPKVFLKFHNPISFIFHIFFFLFKEMFSTLPSQNFIILKKCSAIVCLIQTIPVLLSEYSFP